MSSVAAATAAPTACRIDADFAGGNIVVEKTEGDTVWLRQDLRDTEGQWFYWAFRVRGAGGRRLSFRFTNGNVIGVLGPAMSLDRGATWRWHEAIHFVATPDARIWKNTLRLSSVLEGVQHGPLRFDGSVNLPFGKAWNTPANTGAHKSFAMWAGELPGVEIATTLEIPYANAMGREVDAGSARSLGYDLARALREYLEHSK